MIVEKADKLQLICALPRRQQFVSVAKPAIFGEHRFQTAKILA